MGFPGLVDWNKKRKQGALQVDWDEELIELAERHIGVAAGRLEMDGLLMKKTI